MNNYNKNAKLIHIAFAVIIFLILILTVVYMTQYKNLFLFYSDSFGFSQNTTNINNNTDWKGFIQNIENNEIVKLRDMLGLVNVKTAFVDSCNVIRNQYVSINNVNHLLLYLSVVSAICLAMLFISSNHSRRIYYRSNLISGIVFPAIIIIFALYVGVRNTILIKGINENHLLFNSIDYVVKASSKAVHISDLNVILNHNYINPLTIIIADILLSVLIGYSLFMILYAVKRYKVCTLERKEIIAKAVLK
jgi:hypothetical protein